MSGALPCGTGLGAPEGAEPPARLGASPAIPSAGAFVIYETGSSYRPHAAGVIAQVTPKMAKLSKSTNYDRQIYRDRIVAVFDNAKDAARLEQSLAGAYGEFSRRRSEADAERAARVSKAHETFRRTAERLCASAMSASGQDPEEGLGAKPASAVGDSRDAQGDDA